MKPLDDFIKSNRERFDNDEPLDGHFDRFGGMLDEAYKAKRLKGWRMVLKIAAVVVLGLILTYAAVRETSMMNRKLGYMVSAAEFPELREVEKYYTSQMDVYYSKIKNLRFENDTKQRKQILDELSDMDRQVMTLKYDLSLNPEDEHVVHAIINYYQVKLEFMDMIITRTQKSDYTIL